MKLFNPFALPLMKSALPIEKQPNLFRAPPLNSEMTRRLVDPTEEALQMLRRRVRDDGFEIIDKPTYHKLTKEFVRNNGIIIRGQEAEKHLGTNGHASYLPSLNSAFIRDDATVSDVLEEMHHAKQDRLNRFSDEPTAWLTTVKREIETQNYLLSMTDKYKIPRNEVEQTKRNLQYWQEQLRKEESKWKNT